MKYIMCFAIVATLIVVACAHPAADAAAAAGSAASAASSNGSPGDAAKKLFNPLEIGKDIIGGILKNFGGAGAAPSKQKDASAAAAGGASAATAAQKSPAAAAKTATGGKDVFGTMEEAGSKMISGMFGGFGL